MTANVHNLRTAWEDDYDTLMDAVQAYKRAAVEAAEMHPQAGRAAANTAETATHQAVLAAVIDVAKRANPTTTRKATR
jgi:uncharacterized protein (DUF362 family)